MFWTIFFLGLKFIAAILVIYAIAEFVTWKAIKDYEAEKKKKVVYRMPHNRKGC